MTGSEHGPAEWPGLATVILYESSPVALDSGRFVSAVRRAVGALREVVLDPRQIEDSDRMLLRTAHVPETVYAFSYRRPLPVNAPAGPSVPPDLARRLSAQVDGLILEIFSKDEHWATAAVTRLAGELAGEHTLFLWSYNTGRLLEATAATLTRLRSDDAASAWESAIDAPAFK